MIGLFGMVGALCRYYLSDVPLFVHSIFPLGTLICNLLGCFVLGWFNQRIRKSNKIHQYIKTGISTGLIGSFTTFSTFSVETLQLFKDDSVILGILYILVSFIGGWFFVWVGDKLGKSHALQVGER